MAAPPVRIAVVGMGVIGPRHAQAVQDNPDAELLCIVDPSPSARDVASGFGVPLYVDVTAMLGTEPRPDAAIVCTPNDTHVGISMQLLQAGVHVLVEKPLAVDVESGERLVACAKEMGLHLLTGHHRRFNRFVNAAALHLPACGRILGVSGIWALFKPDEYFDALWRRGSSGGPVWINLIHEIDVLQFLLGPISSVMALETGKMRGFEAEEGAGVLLRFEGGAVGTFMLSDAVVSPHAFEAGTGENPMIAHTGMDVYRFFGTHGTLSVPDMTLWTSSGERSWSTAPERSVPPVDEAPAPFVQQVANFVAVVRGEEAPRCSGEDGLRAVKVVMAIKRAMRERREVAV